MKPAHPLLPGAVAITGYQANSWGHPVHRRRDNFAGLPIDPPSSTWLGRRSAREAIRTSGLWNVNHVRDAALDDRFLSALHRHLH